MTILNVSERVEERIRQEAERLDYQIVNISTRGGDTFFMDVALDKEGGISIDECGEFSRNISSWIEGQDMLKSGYTLDVCSPGLDRELRSEGEFSWAMDKEVRMTVHSSVEGKNVIIGKLVEVNGEESIVVEEPEGGTITVDRKNIAKAKLNVRL